MSKPDKEIVDYLNIMEDVPALKQAANSLILSIIAQTCTDYFRDARSAMFGNASYKVSEKTFRRKVEGYKQWFLDPNSEFNTLYKNLYQLTTDNPDIVESKIFDGEAMVAKLDEMVADTETYPDNYYDFVSKVHI